MGGRRGGRRPRGSEGPDGQDADKAPPEDALPETAAQALRRRIHDLDVDQKQLAADLGVTPTTVSRWVNRKQGMPLGMLERIASRLDVPLAALFAGTVSPGLLEARSIDLAMARQALDQAEKLHALVEREFSTMHALLKSVRRYQLGAPGDPRRGPADASAARQVGAAQVPLGSDWAVGPRGFAVQLEGEELAGRGLQPGDVLFCNPDSPWGEGSLVVLGLSVDPAGQPGPMAVRELVFGPTRTLDARTVPELGPPETAPSGAYIVYGPVTVVHAVAHLPEGRGHLQEARRRAVTRPQDRGAPPISFQSNPGAQNGTQQSIVTAGAAQPAESRP